MGDTDTDSRLAEIESLRTRLAELENDTVEEVEEVITVAEENTAEVAEAAQEESSEAVETVTEAEQQVEEAVQEEAHEAADALGHPELAGHIADELFQRLEERGVLPHHQAQPVTEAVPVVEAPAEVSAEVEAPVRDVAPEPQHFWYRPVRFGRR